MRALRRPPSRYTLRRASREPGKPAAALAIIATIFATAFVIKLLPPADRDALLPVTHHTLPSRELLIWAAAHEPVSTDAIRVPAFAGTRRDVVVTAPEATFVETTADVPPMLETDPGQAPVLSSAVLMPAALPMGAIAVAPETEAGSSPIVSAFTKTRSALRLAFVKTGSAFSTLRP